MRPFVASRCDGDVAATGFPAEKVTTLLADWDDAPDVYAAHTVKLVLHRPPLPRDARRA